ARRRGLIAPPQLLAGLDHRESLRGVDPERLEHFRGEDLAHRALERQAAVRGAAPRRQPTAFGAKVEQPAGAVANLREGETAAVADLRVVNPELVAVVA